MLLLLLLLLFDLLVDCEALHEHVALLGAPVDLLLALFLGHVVEALAVLVVADIVRVVAVVEHRRIVALAVVFADDVVVSRVRHLAAFDIGEC